MNSNERKKIEMARAINNLSASIYHFNQLEEINYENTYAITILFRDIKNIDYKRISDQLDAGINKAITEKEKPNNNKRIGLFLGFDVEGTRDRNPVIKGYICPHMHGCIFIQNHTINNRSEGQIIDDIKNEIMKNGTYTKAEVQRIWIGKINDYTGNLLKYLSYSSKAENYEGITSQLNKTTFIYPFDKKINKSNKIALNMHKNDKQQEKVKAEIGNRIEELSHRIATKPVQIFGIDKGMDILGEYISLYMKCHGGKRPRNFKAVYAFMANLVKPDKACLH